MLLLAIALLGAQNPEVQLFDGKSLTGWEKVGGGEWTVNDRTLKGTCRKADEQGILVYKDEVEDFSANLEFRISSGNSGFYFRAEKISEQPLVKGFQAEIDAIDDVAGIWETGGRGWVFKPTPELHSTGKFKPGEWTRMYVSAVGDHYVVKLNGQTITDIHDAVGRRKGAVALQLHGGMDMTVEFRNMRMKKATPATP